jgi:hypothetical protein
MLVRMRNPPVPAVAEAFLAALLADAEAVYGWSAEESGDGDPSESAGRAYGEEPAPRSSRQTILVVDDDDLVRATVAATMEDAGYDVIEACDGKEALAFLERNSAEIAALVSDIRMPRMNGLELASTVAREWPCIAIVLVSGYSATDRKGEVPEAAVFVPKPFRPDALADALRRALAHRGGH